MSAAIRARSSAAWLVLAAAWVLSLAAWATPEMVWAMSVEPLAASVTLRLISLVVAVCSSTAEAIVVWVSLIWAMISEISPMAVTALLVSAWIVSMRRLMSSVAWAVSWAS